MVRAIRELELRRLLSGYGLRSKLLRRVGGTVLVIFVVTDVLTYMKASNALQQQAVQTGCAQAQVAASEINALLQTVAARSAQMSAVVALGSLNTAQLRTYFRNLLPTIPASQAYNDYVFFQKLDYRNKNAQIFYIRPTWPEPRYLNYDYHTSAHAWYSVPARTRRPFVSEPFFASGGSNESMVSVVSPVLHGSELLGVAGVDLTLAPLSTITDALRFGSPGNQDGNGSYAFLISSQRNLVTFPDRSSLVGDGRPGQTITTVDGGSFAAVADASGAAVTKVTQPGGTTALVFTQPVPAAGWKLALVVPESLIYAPLNGLRQQAIALTIAGTALMLTLVVLLTGRIVRPITLVKQAAERLALGDVSVAKVLPPPSSDEVGELTVAFRLMEETLHSAARERLEQAEAATALAEAGAALATALEPEPLYDIVLHQMARVVPCDTACILEFRDGWAVVAGTYGEPSLPVGVRVASLESAQSIFPQTERQARLLLETRDAPEWHSIPPLNGTLEVRSAIILPMLAHAELHGCLIVGNVTPGFYEEPDFQMARVFGQRIAQALWSARLYRLEQQRALAAEQLAAQRSDFVAAVSHELRTPLAAVLGYAELLQGRWDQMNDQQRRARIDRIVDGAKRQHELIENLLHVSRVESNTPVLRRESVRVAHIVNRAVTIVQGSYPSQRVDVDGPEDLQARADASHVEQILTNLLDNAAKYSPEGAPVGIQWALEEKMTVVRVRDFGPGIAAEGSGILFSRFGRVPGSRMRAGRVGTGLGLYLGREFAEAMGGTLDLESTGPTGSVFRLRLPAQAE